MKCDKCGCDSDYIITYNDIDLCDACMTEIEESEEAKE